MRILILSLIIFIFIFLAVILYFVTKGYDYEEDEYDLGEIGEKRVAKILGDSIDGEKQVFNDYKFLSAGKSVQVDHIYINKNGIFVIETKNYSGAIFGTEEQQEWTQVLACGNVKNKFYNPIKQNKSHIYKLSKFLPKDIDIISVVVFIDADIENVDSDIVCTLNDLKNILETESKKQLSSTKINYIANILRRYQNNNITEEEHINNIHKMQEDIENNICPRCGSKLVIRDGGYGEFYGCSNYPKCKFKKKI